MKKIVLGRDMQIARMNARNRQAQISADSAIGAASIAFVVMAENGIVDEVTATEHIDIFSPWVEGIAYSIGDLRTFGEGDDRKLYRCVQAHSSQASWTPPVTAALWAVAGDPAVEFPDWSAPVGAHDAYAKGDKVTYSGKKWISTSDANVWAPGIYGWQIVTE